MTGGEMFSVGAPEVLFVALAGLSWPTGLVASIRKLREKDSAPRRLHVLLALVAGPLGVFVAASAWLCFPPATQPMS